MHTNILIGFIFYEIYCNSIKYCRYTQEKECRYYCCNNTPQMKQATGTSVIKISAKDNKMKTNLNINKCESIEPDINNSPVNLSKTEHIRKNNENTAHLTPKETPLPECSKDNAAAMAVEINQTVKLPIDNIENKTKNCGEQSSCGLLHYRKWWERTNVEILVNGKLITGIPIFIEKNTLRVINNEYSYFIPLEKVDYIRTTDGLDSCSD